MSKHTPGPWTAGKKTVRDDHGFKVYAFPVSGNGQAVAAVWAGSVGKEVFGFDNQEANAALIAAAPDLLAALQAMVDAWDMSDEEGQHRRIWDDARAAIAKAEGPVMNIQLDAEPDTSVIGDIVMVTCMTILLGSSFYLCWAVFVAVHDSLT